MMTDWIVDPGHGTLDDLLLPLIRASYVDEPTLWAKLEDVVRPEVAQMHEDFAYMEHEDRLMPIDAFFEHCDYEHKDRRGSLGTTDKA